MIECAVKLDTPFEAGRLVQTASRFKSHVSLVSGEKTANAKSVMGIISLDLTCGNTVKIIADGEDEKQVISEIEDILSKGDNK